MRINRKELLILKNQIIMTVKSMENDNKKLEKLSNLKEFEEFYLFLRENGYEGTKEQFTKELVEILNENRLVPTEDSELDCVAGGGNFKSNISKALSVGMASLLAISSSPLQPQAHASSLNNSSSFSRSQGLSPRAKDALIKASAVAIPTALLLGGPLLFMASKLGSSNSGSEVDKTKKNPSEPSRVQGVVSEKIVKDLSAATRVLMDFGNTFGVNNRVLNDETLDEIHLLAENTLNKSAADFNLVEVLQWLANLNKLATRVEESCWGLGHLDDGSRGELTYIENTIDNVCSSLGVNRDQLDSFGKDEAAQEELRNLKEDLKQSQEKEKRTQEELNKAKQNVISYERTLKELRNELRVAEQKMQETAQNLQKIKADQRSRTQSELIEARKRYQESETKCAQLSNKIKELEELKEGSDKEIETLRTELNTAQETKETVEENLGAPEKPVEELKVSDESSKEEVQNLETQSESGMKTSEETATESEKAEEEIVKSQEQAQSLTAPVMDVVAEQSSQAQTEQAQAVPEINLSKNMIGFINKYGKYFNLNKENCKVNLNQEEIRDLRTLVREVETQFREIEDLNEHVFTETYKDCVPENFEQCLKMLCQRIADTLHYRCCEEGVWERTDQNNDDIANKVAPLCGVNMEHNMSTGDHRNMRDVFKNNSLDMWVLATFLRAKFCERFKTRSTTPVVDKDKEEYAKQLGEEALKCIDMIQAAAAKRKLGKLPYLEKFKELDEEGEFGLLFEKFVEYTVRVRPVVVGTEKGVDLFLNYTKALNEYLKNTLAYQYNLSDKYLISEGMNFAAWAGIFNFLNLHEEELHDPNSISNNENRLYGIMMGVRNQGTDTGTHYDMASRFKYDEENGEMIPAPIYERVEGSPYYFPEYTMGSKEVQRKYKKHNPKKVTQSKKQNPKKGKKKFWT